MTDELDLRLSAAFRSLDLPAAAPRLTETLDGLRVAGPAQGSRASQRPWIVPLAAAASIVVAVALVVSQLGIVPFGPSPSPTPSPTPVPTSTPSPNAIPTQNTGWPAYTVGTLLTARAAGDVGGEQVLVIGWWTDLRPDAACGTPSPSPLIIACGDGQFGLTDSETPMGTWDGNVFVPTDGPAFTPLLPPGLPTPGLGRSLIGLRDENGDPHPPVSTTVVGRFDSQLADACPAELRQACRDRFVIDEIIWAEASSRPVITPNPSAAAPAPDDPPPATVPGLVDTCSLPRTPFLEPGDPARLEVVSSGWVPFEALDVQPLTIEFMTPLAPAWVYVVVTEPDVRLSTWKADPAGGDRTFRWIGQAVCIGWSEGSGVWYSTVPGTTYELWSDGERVPLEVFPPEPSPRPTP